MKALIDILIKEKALIEDIDFLESELMHTKDPKARGLVCAEKENKIMELKKVRRDLREYFDKLAAKEL